MAATPVYFADVLPGTGKTRWAISQMVSCLRNKDSIILYVAPTTELLDEVHSKLVRSGAVGINNLHMLASKGANISVVLSGLPVVAQIMMVLNGGTLPNSVITFDPCPKGTVVLITHEAFLGLPHNLEVPLPEGLRKINRRSEIKVIFDEARKCLLKEAAFDLPGDAVDSLFDHHLELRGRLDSGFQTLHLKDTHNLSLKTFNALFEHYSNKVKDVASSLWKILSILRATPSNDLYVKSDWASDGKGTQHLTMHVLLVPQRLFHGWLKVVLLSAFFKCSQMYHLLRKFDVSQKTDLEQRASQYAIKLVDISDKVVSKKRLDAVLARYAKTTITYISPNSAFSKTQLLQGVLINSGFQDDAFAEDFRTWVRENSKGLHLRKACELLIKGEARGDFHALMKRLPLYAKNKYRPLQFYAKAADCLSRAWYRRIGEEIQPLPMMTNVGGRKGRIFEPVFWDTEVLSVLPSDRVIALPFGVHGLNKFMGYHTLAYLASINPTPEAKSLFGSLCVDYNSDLDHTVDHAVQAAMRISMRNTEDKTKPLVIVTDLQLATRMHEQLRGMPNLLPPNSLCPKIPILDILSIPLRQTREDQTQRMKVDPVYATSVRKRIASQVSRSLAKTKGRDDFVKANSKYRSRVTSLKSHISKLKKREVNYESQQRELNFLLPKFKAEQLELRKQYEAAKAKGTV